MSDLQKKLKRHSALTIGLFAIALLVAGCGKKAETPEGGEEAAAPTPVTAEPVLRGAIDHVDRKSVV